MTGEGAEASGDILTISSVGIDIGSSTSHLIFSRLVLERQGIRLSSGYTVVQRDVLHKSPIILTPYADVRTIDTAALTAFVADAYRQAGVHASEIDTGALIVTGNAALKVNAERIARALAGGAGTFVCATAGPHLEARLAAHGSGAVERSRDGSTVLNLDVGGGTTKIAIARAGQVVDTAAVAIGARVVAVDGDGRIARLEPGAQEAARAAGVALVLGAPLGVDRRAALARSLAAALVSVIAERRFVGLARDLLVTDPIVLPERIDAIQLSGGVAEYVYRRESRDVGDLGRWLGDELRSRLLDPRLPSLVESHEGIRATVIGAGQYTLQLSGSTIFVSRPDLLPMRDVRVLRPAPGGTDRSSVSGGIARALRHDRSDGGEGNVAVALHAAIEPSYPRLRELAEGIASGTTSLETGRPLVLLFDTDIGRSVGTILHEELLPERPIVAIDEVRVGDFAYVDLGSSVAHTQAVPVVVKTLVFRGTGRGD